MSFIKEYKNYIIDTLSFIALICAMVFAFNHAYKNPIKDYNKLINSMSLQYKNDEIKLYAKLKEGEEEEKQSTEIELDIIPALLQRINDTCKAPDVIIRKLDPIKDNPFAFTLEFVSNYFDFINVLSEFEKLNILIHTIDVQPYKIKDNKQMHIVTLNIEAIDGGDKLPLEKIAKIEKEINKEKKRDPFQRFAKLGTNIQRLIDLTWMYKLSGIGKIDGKFVATIDRKVYFENEIFHTMRIIEITNKSVYLQEITKNGVTNFVLNFRTTAKETNNE